MTKDELNIIDNVIKQTITELDNSLNLTYYSSDVSVRFINGDMQKDARYSASDWKFIRDLDDVHQMSIEVYIDEAETIDFNYDYHIIIIGEIHNIDKILDNIESYDYADYSVINLDILSLVKDIKRIYNNVIDEFNADIHPENITVLTETELNAITNTIKQIIPSVDSELRIDEEHFNINILRLYFLNYQKLIEDSIICGILITLDKQGRDYIISTDCYARQISNCNTGVPYRFETFSTKLINNKIDNIDEYINNIKRIYNNTLYQYINILRKELK